MDGIRAHTGTAADYPDYVRLFAELRIDDPVAPPEVWAADLAPHALFLAEDGRNVAFAVAHRYGPEAHIVTLAVAPEARRRGHGRRLLHELGDRLRAEGCTRVRLNVKVGNDAAILLYAGLGLDAHHRSQVIRLPWSAAARLPRGPVPAVIVPAPADDGELERRHDLLPGSLGRWRERGEILAGLEDGAGLARFLPALGAMPFRAPGTPEARALLEALRPHAPPAATHLQLVIEADDDLALALRDAGGILLFEVLHMRGPTPGTPAR